MSADPATWIAADGDLAEWCARWRQAPVLAVDTEFLRTDTYYPKAGLIQIFDGSETGLIDPLAIDDWTPLVAVLTAPKVLKILHSASEDLEVFAKLCGAVPAPLFDTQIAATLAGVAESPGFARLVEALLGIELPKEQTRSDWLQRPLDAEQLVYAVADVTYLFRIYHELRERLERQQRLDWVLADSAVLGERIATLVAPDEIYLRVRAAQSLEGSALAVFRRLCEWRERYARSADRPRGWIVRDPVLVAIARAQPASRRELAAIEDLPPGVLRRNGDALLDCVRRGLDDDPAIIDAPPPARLEPRFGPLLKALRTRVGAAAEELGVAPETLARKRDLVELVLVADGSGHLTPQLLHGWRGELLGEQLSGIVQREWPA